MKKTVLAKAVPAAALLGLVLWGGLPLLRHRHFGIPVVKGPGVTAVLRLSEFSPGLKGTPGDTNVFVLQGREPGGKALLMGDTHANEPEGMLAALIFIENAVVEKGTLYVIPFFNNSASRNTRPGDGYPLYFDVATDWGRAPLPLRQPRRLAARPMARPRRLHPLPRPPAPLLHRRAQHQPDLARPGRRPSHGTGDLRGHGAHAPGEDRRRRRHPRRRDHVPRDQLHRRPGQLGQDRHPGVADRQGDGGLREPRRDVAVRLPGPVAPGDRRPRPVPALPPRGPHPLPRPADRSENDPSSSSTARTPSCSACRRRRSSSCPTRRTAGRSRRGSASTLSVTLEIFRQFSKKTAARPIAVRGVPRYAEVVKSGVGRFLADPAKAAPGGVVMN